MTVVIFSGPTLTPDEGRRILPSAEFLGPLACGDVYRALERRPRAIGICDGYFDHQISVWHKEILWAMAHGVRVYGSASMGALRAAELEAFGMVGVGSIFEQYRDGLLEDDDEVAVIHEPEDRAYRPCSEAMVNIRATLERAVALGLVARDSADRLSTTAKHLFYPDRNYAVLLETAPSVGVTAAEVARLRELLDAGGAVDQKRSDAHAMLQRMHADLEQSVAQPATMPTFRFEYTDAWHALRCRLDHEASGREGATDTGDRELWTEALERSLALALGEIEQYSPDAASVQRYSEGYRRERGLYGPEQTAEWLRNRGLDLEAFSTLVYEELMIQRFRSHAREFASAQVTSLLQLWGAQPREE